MIDADHSAKALLRSSFVRLAMVLTAPLWILAKLEEQSGAETWFTTGSELLSLVPGPFGRFLRRGYYRMTLESFPEDCGIGFGTLVAHRQVRVGRHVYIGSRCLIGMARIEDHATIGSNVDILSGARQHSFEDLGRPIQQQRGVFEPVRIGRNTWIGNSAVIMADVAPDCVIGAGSVVVRPIPERSIAAGNPARVIRSRDSTSMLDPAAPERTGEEKSNPRKRAV
jgi:acetyltransferase-like isoleucine patch superfamily enzyme